MCFFMLKDSQNLKQSNVSWGRARVGPGANQEQLAWLGWTGLDRIGLGRTEPAQAGLCWTGLGWTGNEGKRLFIKTMGSFSSTMSRPIWS